MRLLLEQKYRCRLHMNNRYLELVCVTTLQGAFGRGRSPNRKLRYVISGALATKGWLQCDGGAEVYGNFGQKYVPVKVTNAPGQLSSLRSQ